MICMESGSARLLQIVTVLHVEIFLPALHGNAKDFFYACGWIHVAYFQLFMFLLRVRRICNADGWFGPIWYLFHGFLSHIRACF